MPAPASTVSLTPEQIRQFHEDGFLAIPQITTPEEVDRLRLVFDRLFEERAGRAEGAHFDMVTHDEDDARPLLPTIINPVHFAPELRTTLYRANALHIAQQLLGPKALGAFENAILKPAGYGAATPWHQDEATRADANFDYHQLSIWMPLQEATRENGCMQYLRGTHRGEILPHRSPQSDPRIHAIECVGDFDPAEAISCPLPAGGAVVHHGRTLHYAGPNHSAEPRRAYILAFEIPPQLRSEKREFQWNKEKRAGSFERQRKWRRRGGVIIEFTRKMRAGLWRHPDRVAFEARRAIRALLKRSS